MVVPVKGTGALVPFPFSDLSHLKLRPAVVLASVGRGDWVLCQVTSKPYGDERAIPLMPEDFEAGGLRAESFARPGKLFTAHETLLRAEAGRLSAAAITGLCGQVIAVFE